ncbi:MAG: methylated-DNA--[protein]-cysteine S-methyltransferase [Verrucomicrobia bacterium]|nr:methylated-DNA--[protein]-cysteine S-methyltransferase [Verrucomicrobiota bacterium]
MNSHTRNRYFPKAIATPDGTFLALYSDTGLVSLSFPTGRSEGKSPADAEMPAQIRQWHRVTVTALECALAGRVPPALPPLEVSSGTDFQQAVWRELCRIKIGETRSYDEIARRIGRPNAVRAVGGACGANPIPVLIPCHRVLAAHRKIGGFSGGMDWKRKLLEREGATLR